MTKQLKVTPRTIGSILRKARFVPSVQETTSVRGWYRFTTGYVLTNNTLGVQVTFRNDSQGYGPIISIEEAAESVFHLLDGMGYDCARTINGVIVKG